MKTYSRKAALLLVDIAIINFSLYIALIFRFDAAIPTNYLNIYLHSFVALTFIKIIIFMTFGLYTSLWRYASIDELIQVFFAVFAASIAEYVFGTLLSMKQPNSVYAINCMLTLFFVGSSRISYRVLRRAKQVYFPNKEEQKRVLVIGGGQAGSMVIKEMKENPDMKYLPVAVIDDDKRKYHSSIHGIPVEGGRNKILNIVDKRQIDEIIIAMPAAPKSEISEMLRICKKTKCKLKTLPGVYELIDNRVSIKQIRDVKIEDLLGRDEIKLDNNSISKYLQGETILVTGGGGSIGSELCRQIAKFKPKKLIVFDIYENNVYDLENEMKYIYKDKLDLEIIIGSVRDKNRLREVFAKYRPGVVFHAAAHKHVPLMENNPNEAIKNNVFGTLNTAQCANEFGAKKFVLVSTDKAVNPTNIMGATKRMAEMIVQSMDKMSKTEFVAVRFGNVLGSNGSVIPLFKKQIAHGGPVTVTHPKVTRFFMTIPEASQLVIQAGAMAKGGEIFILDMGESVKIDDLARDLIRLSGFEPDKDIKIEYTGLRPGEKLYEELLLAEEGIQTTTHDNIFVGKPLELSFNEVMMKLKYVDNSMQDHADLNKVIEKIVPTYKRAVNEAAVGQE
ncbi:MAG: nucleoside-diphosphate sugar epimerase/dehydratase [Lutispora sp.]|nr:nucleoside-diphosphate sugar epimerase/dehydratase [Lutispora sp.]